MNPGLASPAAAAQLDLPCLQASSYLPVYLFGKTVCVCLHIFGSGHSGRGFEVRSTLVCVCLSLVARF